MKNLSVVMMTTKTILIIDDERNVRELIALCLKDLGGWNVLTVDSAIEGLHRAAIDRPDAIVLDISMPGMDGLMFLERLRKNPETQAIPVVLLSAKTKWIDPQILREYKIAGAIAKPFDPVELPIEIARLLRWD